MSLSIAVDAAPTDHVGGQASIERTDQSRASTDLGDELARLVTERQDPCWSIRLDETWAHADNSSLALPSQGWKLHVSATEATVGTVLRRCAAILLEVGCSFKVARTIGHVRSLTAAHCDRGSAGKVLTAYPMTEEGAVVVAGRLHDATSGLAAPRILNDRALCPGSAVHYRYGVFTGTSVLTHDGEFELSLMSPEGCVERDLRSGTYTPPSWVVDPFVDEARQARANAAAAAGGTAVLLGDRFVVREAIRHANRGGVFRAEDTMTGASTIVKQARAHVGSDDLGRDVRDRLRHEWNILGQLADLAILPSPVALFEQGADLFLAEEDVAAPTLRTWIAGDRNEPAALPNTNEVIEVLLSIASSLQTLHARGVILRDLSPNNVLVRPDRTTAFVDPELAIADGATDDLCRQSGTMAYASPEQLDGSDADRAMDLHALGAVTLFAFTAEDPILHVDGSTTIDEWIARGARRLSLPPGVAGLASRLCGKPATRPTAESVALQLADLSRVAAQAGWKAADDNERAAHAVANLTPISESTLDTAIDHLLRRLCDEVSNKGQRVARASMFGESTLPTNVQHGAGGLAGVLVQAARLLDDSSARAAAGSMAAWIEQASTPVGGAVGLHFGHAGPAWALAEVADLLGDAAMRDRALERALALGTEFPGPDVAQGLSGLGLTMIRMWELTRDERARDRVAVIAEVLTATCIRDDHGTTWRTPPTAQSSFAGKRFYGFAHGTAGIGTFLRCAADVLADGRLLDLAVECAHSLQRGALTQTDGRVLWGSGPEEPEPGLPHWCNGSSGVASFLVRMTGDLPVSSILDGAARAIVAAKWHSGVAYCHGLSGNADALIDLHDAVGGPYRTWAADLLQIMWDRRQVDDCGPGLSDEPGRVTPDFGVGYGGALSVLLRMRHGGPRLWLPAGLS